MATTIASRKPSDRLVSELRSAIDSGSLRPGQRVATLRQLASDYGVALNTARAAIDQLKTEGRLVSRQGSGTYVAVRPAPSAAQVRPSHPSTVALALDLHGHVYGPLSNLLLELLSQHGWVAHGLDIGRRRNPAVVEETLQRWRHEPPDVIVTHAPDDLLQRMLEAAPGTPIVDVFGQAAPHRPIHVVGPDMDQTMAQAADFLVERGHRRVGIVTHVRWVTPDQPWNRRKRLVGGTQQLLALGRRLRQHVGRGSLTIGAFRQQADDPAGPLSSSCLREVRAWLQRPDRPTAFAGEDFRLVQVIRAAQGLGLEPGRDFDLLGFGNTPWSQAFNFSSISYNEPIIAQRVVDLIRIPGLRESGSRYQVTVDARIIERGESGPWSAPRK
jgi:DNA-binding LacI/PurR family transcriptional regulator